MAGPVDKQPGGLATFKLGASAVVHRRPGRVFLTVTEGADAGKELRVDRSRVTGGRSQVNDLVLTDSSVSATHFELALADDGRVILRDLGSTNGIWIAGVRFREAWIEPGSTFFAGRCGIRLVSADEVDVTISASDHFESMFGASPAMREVFAVLERVATTPMDVLVGGETGTGKELVARAIHTRSSRRQGPFVVLDCASLPRELAEATILGHRKGAFTGATADQPGCFEDADGGTLFIDEVGELSLELQPKLLRVLDRREVPRIGETKPRKVDVRVVAATHRDLRRMVGEGAFREDLYFRLAEFVVELPPLRARENDGVDLVRRMLVDLAPEIGRALELDDDACSAIRAYEWPGNVRELRKVTRRAAYMTKTSVVGRADLHLLTQANLAPTTPDDLFALPFKDARDEFERQYIKRLLAESRGNMSEAARRAGYTRQGMRELLKRLDIYAPE